MAAVIGLSGEAVAEVCRKAQAEAGGVVEPANYNTPQQTVISGRGGRGGAGHGPGQGGGGGEGGAPPGGGAFPLQPDERPAGRVRGHAGALRLQGSRGARRRERDRRLRAHGGRGEGRPAPAGGGRGAMDGLHQPAGRGRLRHLRRGRARGARWSGSTARSSRTSPGTAPGTPSGSTRCSPSSRPSARPGRVPSPGASDRARRPHRPMRDGTVLRADVYRPRHGRRRSPRSSIRTPYDRSHPLVPPSAIDPERAIERGFAVVCQDIRGPLRLARAGSIPS